MVLLRHTRYNPTSASLSNLHSWTIYSPSLAAPLLENFCALLQASLQDLQGESWGVPHHPRRLAWPLVELATPPPLAHKSSPLLHRLATLKDPAASSPTVRFNYLIPISTTTKLMKHRDLWTEIQRPELSHVGGTKMLCGLVLTPTPSRKGRRQWERRTKAEQRSSQVWPFHYVMKLTIISIFSIW